MSNTSYTQADYAEAIRRLADSYGSDFAEFVAGHEMMHDVMMKLASEFVAAKLPIVKDEDAIDVAAELNLGITIRTV